MSQFSRDSVTPIILGLFSIIYNSNSSLLFITLRAFKYKHEILVILLHLFVLSPLFVLQLLFLFSLLPLLLHTSNAKNRLMNSPHSVQVNYSNTKSIWACVTFEKNRSKLAATM